MIMLNLMEKKRVSTLNSAIIAKSGFHTLIDYKLRKSQFLVIPLLFLLINPFITEAVII